MKKPCKIVLSALPLLCVCTVQARKPEKKLPNIIFILADDMGYGDVSALNPASKISTPYIDRMVRQGVAFTDAHSGSSVSTPTRYGILTGRYNWRSSLKSGVLYGYSQPIIPPTRSTMASVLKQKGYTTGCVGKWHLGLNWNNVGRGTDSIDYTRPVTGGPVALGFDYFYGISASLDMPPYVYIENDMPTAVPDRLTRGTGMSFWREGPTAPGFVHEEVLPHCRDKAVDFIREHAGDDAPFFLYVPFPAPHTPILPSAEFRGRSGLNAYGDFVMMLDRMVGDLLNTIDKEGISENTMVVFTTDNGCSPAARVEELTAEGHFPSYIYRGYKADLFEGGHRIPCIVQWKGMFEPASVGQPVCLTDFFATFAELAGVKLHDYEGEDSFSLMPLLAGAKKPEGVREAVVHHSIEGQFSIRKGKWKLLVSPSSGGWSAPTPADARALAGLPPLQLYDLDADPGETENLCGRFPGVTRELMMLLRRYVREGRSTPGIPQKNDAEGNWKQLEQVFRSYPGLM